MPVAIGGNILATPFIGQNNGVLWESAPGTNGITNISVNENINNFETNHSSLFTQNQ